MSEQEDIPQAVFIAGNLSEGYVAYGPYESMCHASEAHDLDEGWMMELRPSRESKVVA